MLAALFVVLLGTLSGVRAQAFPCSQVVNVSAVGFGAALRSEDERLADAITSALNQAISQELGVFVSTSTELFEEFRSDLVSGIDTSVEFREQIRSRFSGFITDYSVDYHRQVAGSVFEVGITAGVCLDPRVALGFDGDAVVRESVTAALVRGIFDAGWRIVEGAPRTAGADLDLLDFAYEVGVTYIARASTTASSAAIEGGFQSATVTLDVVLLDARDRQIVHVFNHRAVAAGATVPAALQRAGQEAGEELAREWNRVLLPPERATSAVFVFRNVARAGTLHSLEEIVLQAPGVLRIVASGYDRDARTARIELSVAGDTCVAAERVTSYRRVWTSLSSCSHGRANFDVSGD